MEDRSRESFRHCIFLQQQLTLSHTSITKLEVLARDVDHAAACYLPFFTSGMQQDASYFNHELRGARQRLLTTLLTIHRSSHLQCNRIPLGSSPDAGMDKFGQLATATSWEGSSDDAL